MPDLALAAPPPRAELLRQLRERLPEALPGVQVVAEGILGAGTPIDLLAIDAGGRAVLVLVGGPDEGLELLGRGLAQRAWVEPRLGDWLQLAPQLALRPEAGVGLVLMAPGFTPEVEAAARSLGDAAPTLRVYRCVRNGAGVSALVEPDAPAPAGGASLAPEPSAAPELPPFRTGLTDADLGLDPDERPELG